MPDLSGMLTVVLRAAPGAVACLCSAVGHGGATGYLAAMVLLGLAPAVARPGALPGTHWGGNCWRTVAFRRAPASGPWIAAGKPIFTGK